ncbi:MAG: terminase small subunit [Oscillospiraceae bacterium]|nr:terminase small subunit [Oscillospiraceae bacterium]
MQQSPSPDRRAFCRWFMALGNPAEAARRAGFPAETAEQEALRLLQTPACRSYLSQLAAQPPLPLQSLCIAGLARLAFGAANDAAKLVFADEMPSDSTLSALDLFHVSELKRDKGGGVEVKLFDRQKAMERLLECAASADSAAAASALLAALSGAEHAAEPDTREEDAG